MKPWHVRVFGSPIHIGKFATLIASSDNKIRLSVWSNSPDKGSIHIGNYCMICPGVRIGSAEQIRIGDNCMIASNSYIADSDWHVIYNRIEMGKTAPVSIADNVWVGEGAIVCKGVSIGENSIIGAGAVVTKEVKSYALVVGNPSQQVGWMSEYGHRLSFDDRSMATCPESKEQYKLEDDQVSKITA